MELTETEQKTMARWSVALEAELSAKLATSPPKFHGDGKKPVWSIDTPPPYPSGRWHIGAVAGYSLIDMVARSKRMEGYDVLFPWGVDRNGINIEFTVEKASGKRMQDWDRHEFNNACREAITPFSDDMKRVGRRIGLSCDFDAGYETDSPEYRAFSQACFIELYKKGLVVEDLRPNTYDPKLQTTIADAEVFHEERKTRLNHVKWSIAETGETVLISTTRPELIAACQVVLVHPENEATKHLIGKHAVLPVYGREVEIRAHTHVKSDFGSGIMMVCSFGDQADVALFRELQLEPIAAIGLDGKMTEVTGILSGLKVEEARKQMIAHLEETGQIDSFTQVNQKFPISERSKSAVETILLKEWYVKQTHCVEELKKIAHGISFNPAKHRQLLLDWIDTVSIDWPISRRRYYHTEIPLWYVVDSEGAQTDFIAVPEGGPYYQPWQQDVPENAVVMHRETREILGPLQEFLKANLGHATRGETKVFDTWMDSSVSNKFILRDYQDKAWAKDHVCSIRTQGRDIVRTWLYYTLLKTHLLDGRSGFQHALIHGMGMDKHGKKMSKSLGNVIDPDSVIDLVGSDAFRLWMACESTIGDDFRINTEKIQGASKFLQKMANVASFVLRFDNPALPAKLAMEDEWILGELETVRAKATAAYKEMDFFGAANEVRNFVWNLFAPHYLEMVKGRAYDGDAAACATLHTCVQVTAQLLAPVTPMFSHHVMQELYGRDPHAETFVSSLGKSQLTGITDVVCDFNSLVWKTKKDQGLSLAGEIAGIEIPTQIEGMRGALVSMHKLV